MKANSVIGADLNGVSAGGNLTSDFTFVGCSFSNWGTADINVGNANLHAKLIACETKGYNGTFSIIGPGNADLISCYETNTGNTTTRRYGNPTPSNIAVDASPFTFTNSIPPANGQWCALMIYWFGGTVSCYGWRRPGSEFKPWRGDPSAGRLDGDHLHIAAYGGSTAKARRLDGKIPEIGP